MIGIATGNQGRGARHSKTLSEISRKDKRIWKYYFEDESHWIILEDGYEFDSGMETTGEPNVKCCLDKIKRITKTVGHYNNVSFPTVEV